MIRFNPLSKDPEEIRRMWYVPPRPQYDTSWILYTRNFVLQTLQGCYRYPEKVKDNCTWRIISTCVWFGMACTQLVIMFLSYIPIVTWVVYMLITAFPRNAVGFFLRGSYWKSRLRRLGVDTLIDAGVEINGAHLVEIGSHCHIDRNVLLSVGAERGSITIRDNVFIGPHCHVVGRGGIDIGSFAALSAHVHIYSVTNLPYHMERLGELMSMTHTTPFHQQSTTEKPVTVGEYATIGFSSMILPGVSLGFGAIVHAFAEVDTSFPDFTIVSGHGRARQQGWRRPGKLDERLQSMEKAR